MGKSKTIKVLGRKINIITAGSQDDFMVLYKSEWVT